MSRLVTDPKLSAEILSSAENSLAIGRVSSHLLEQRVHSRGGGLRNELVLRRKVSVEPAVRQPGGLHAGAG